VGQLSDPYQNEEDDQLGITISGLPAEPEEPDDVVSSGPEEPEGDFEAEAVELADGDRVSVEGTGLDTEETVEGDTDADGDLDAAAAGSVDDEDDGLDDEDGDEDGEVTGDEVAYDLTEWEDDQLSSLFDKLTDAGIDYLWDGEELYVREEDEVATDVVIEQVSYPDQLDEEEDDGDAGANLLGGLYIAADRLQHDPEEHEAIASLLTLADTADEASAPYGLSDEEWKHLHEKVDSLAQLLEAEKIDIEEAAASARQLRNAIRPYV
jgi:hypothetical protein